LSLLYKEKAGFCFFSYNGRRKEYIVFLQEDLDKRHVFSYELNKIIDDWQKKLDDYK